VTGASNFRDRSIEFQGGNVRVYVDLQTYNGDRMPAGQVRIGCLSSALELWHVRLAGEQFQVVAFYRHIGLGVDF